MLHTVLFHTGPININDKRETVTEISVFGLEYRESSPANHQKLKLLPNLTNDLFTV